MAVKAIEIRIQRLFPDDASVRGRVFLALAVISDKGRTVILSGDDAAVKAALVGLVSYLEQGMSIC